jgi:hypothetical protein
MRWVIQNMSPRQCKWLVKIILRDLKARAWEGDVRLKAHNMHLQMRLGCGAFADPPSIHPHGHCPANPSQPPQAGLAVERVLADYHPDGVRSFNM